MKKLALVFVIVMACCSSCKIVKTANVDNLYRYKQQLDNNVSLSCEEKYTLLKDQIDLYFKPKVKVKQQ
jgi:hypothetical protein